MRTFGEGGSHTVDFFNEDILQYAEEIKQKIIEDNRTLGGENGYDFRTFSPLKGEYNSNPEDDIWIRIVPNFDTKSAKLTFLNNYIWTLDSAELWSMGIVEKLLKIWDIRDYQVRNKFNQYIISYQPIDEGL